MPDGSIDLEMILKELRVLGQRLNSALSVLGRHHLQIEAYLSLHAFLQPHFPFPPMGPEAVAPDLALILASQILQARPNVIIELGSGVSTLVAGYVLQRNGRGRLISLEHSEAFAAAAADSVARHGLNEYVQVVHSPLKTLVICGEDYQWYDRGFLRMLDHHSVELLLVDGPPGFIGKLSRYPAMPVLHDYLARNTIVILDDADREDERSIASRWSTEYPKFNAVHLPTIKGTLVLKTGGSHDLPSRVQKRREPIR